jgi:hypothetical protein
MKFAPLLLIFVILVAGCIQETPSSTFSSSPSKTPEVASTQTPLKTSETPTQTKTHETPTPTTTTKVFYTPKLFIQPQNISVEIKLGESFMGKILITNKGNGTAHVNVTSTEHIHQITPRNLILKPQTSQNISFDILISNIGTYNATLVFTYEEGIIEVPVTIIVKPPLANLTNQSQIAPQNQTIEMNLTFTIPTYPMAKIITIPENLWSEMGIPVEAERRAYITNASVDELTKWYEQQMSEWKLEKDIGHHDPMQGVDFVWRLYKRNDYGAVLFFQSGPQIPKGSVFGIATGSWNIFENLTPAFEEHVEYTEEKPPFANLPELGEGAVTFEVSPIDFDAIERVEPLGRLNAPMGHVFPTEHGGFILKDPSSFYEIRAPADGIIIEIEFSPKSEEYRITIAHSRTFSSIFDHITKLSDSIAQLLAQQGYEFKPNTYRIKIPIKAGDVIGLVGGHPDVVVGFDWGVYDKEVTNNFIHPEKYDNKYLHATHFINYCSEDLKRKFLAKLPRTAEPVVGKIDYDQPGKLVGNWILEETTKSEAIEEWRKHLSFVYDYLDPTQIRIGIGGFLTPKPGTYAVYGNTPDPADVGIESGKVVYWLYGDPELNPDLPKITLIVELISEEKIKVEVFEGWINNPDFTENALYYTR